MDIDSYDTPAAQALLRSADERAVRRLDRRHELLAHTVGAAAFFAAASLLAALAPWDRTLSPSSFAPPRCSRGGGSTCRRWCGTRSPKASARACSCRWSSGPTSPTRRYFPSDSLSLHQRAFIRP